MKKTIKQLAMCLSWLPFVSAVHAEALQVGQTAPSFQLKNQDGNEIKLTDRQNQGWTVLYFYPKADTPGCTKQACAFRDSIQLIRDQNAEVYGVSTDEVSSLQAFQQKYKLNFTFRDVVARHGGNDDVLQPHPAGGFGHAERFVSLERERLGRADRAKAAGACAAVAGDHEGGRAFFPALPMIRALRALADGVQLEFAQQIARLREAVRRGQLDAEPFGQARA